MDSNDVFRHNQAAWDHEARSGNRWTVPVDSGTIARARAGNWSVLLTPTRSVPRSWFPGDLRGCRVLALASGGGQQGPILAAAGADVTVFDASAEQLLRDDDVACRDGLQIITVQGDMADLSRFDDGAFDLVFHPVSNCFIPDVLPVWREVARVLAPEGLLLAGVVNPVEYALDHDCVEAEGALVLRYAIPYADPDARGSAFLKHMLKKNEPLEFGHTLEDLLGGQMRAGLVMTDLYEDRWDTGAQRAVSSIMATFLATRAMKPVDH